LLETCDPFDAALLRAGRNEAPREGGKERVLAAVGIATAGSLWLTAWWKIGTFGWKWFGVGLFVVAGGTIAVRMATAKGSLVTRSPEGVEIRAAARIEHREISPATAPSSTRELLADAPVVAPSPKPRAAPKRETRVSTLGDELALVRRAKAEIARGDAQAALGTLDVHDRAFPKGALLAEAEVVRVEALVAVGQPQRAAEHAWAFLERHQDSPYAERLRRLVRRLPLGSGR
jgi:hypothetical protein